MVGVLQMNDRRALAVPITGVPVYSIARCMIRIRVPFSSRVDRV